MLSDTYTSTGAKFFAHQEAMTKLRNGRGQPITTHVMLTDVCNHTCAFCSVQARAGDSLPFDAVKGYLTTLIRYGLKSVILSGGGNPILYKNGGVDFNNVVDWIHAQGLEIGLITNGMPLKEYESFGEYGDDNCTCEDQGVSWPCEAGCCYRRATRVWRGPGRDVLYCDKHAPKVNRRSWKIVLPATLDKLTWIRISMAGLDHEENQVFVPDIDPTKTTLGFSYVAHDIYIEPADPHHGKVSTSRDLLSSIKAPDVPFEPRIPVLIEQIRDYVRKYDPKYVRLLPNCLEPDLIPGRCAELAYMVETINSAVGREVAFVQYKPPKAPHACYLGYVHPVLNCDGYIYPCDSCVLNEAAGHQFANPWRMCRWDEIQAVYDAPVRSLIADPARTCPGCVFTRSNELLEEVVDGTVQRPDGLAVQEHVNFI